MTVETDKTAQVVTKWPMRSLISLISMKRQKSKDVESIAVRELLNSAFVIAIEAIEDSDNRVELYEKAF